MGYRGKKEPKIKKDPVHAWGRFGEKTRLLLTYGWPRKSRWLQARVLFCFLLMVAGRLVNVAIPLYSKWIVNDLHKSEGDFNYTLIYMAVFLKFMQGSGTMGGLLSIWRVYLWIPIHQYTFRELEVELFSHLHSLPMQWHVNRHIGMVLKVANRGSHSVNDILNHVLFNVLPTLADFVIAISFFTSAFNIYFGVLVLTTMVSHMALNIGMTEWRTRFRREMNNQENSIGAIGTDSLINYETVKYYGNAKFEVDRYKNTIEKYQLEEWKNNAALALQTILQHAILAVGILSGSCLAAFLITKRHTLTVGDYVLFTTYIAQLYTPLNIFARHYRVIQKAFIDMENMLSLFDEKPEVEDSPDSIEYENKGGEIKVEKLMFSYNERESVLNDISFRAEKGQTIALVGLSGSGKSTIIRILYRLYDYCQGLITVDGMDIKKVKPSTWRKACGIVPQDTFLFNETIRFNIKYGNLEATDAEVEAAAKAAMIHDKIISLPQGYETTVGDRGMKLSGGEKQRLAIARTILKKPNFIFLDEATSALDSHTERAIQRCLDNLCEGRTSIVVAHRLTTVINADCIMVMDKGKIVEKGTHSELMAKEGVYFDLWQTQYRQKEEKKPVFLEEDEDN